MYKWSLIYINNLRLDDIFVKFKPSFNYDKAFLSLLKTKNLYSLIEGSLGIKFIYRKYNVNYHCMIIMCRIYFLLLSNLTARPYLFSTLSRYFIDEKE